VLWIVGADTGKRSLFLRLQGLPASQPGDEPFAGSLVRFSADLPAWWYEQLVSERMVQTKHRGMPVQRFERIPGRRAEALDCMVYAMAARQVVYVTDWEARRVNASMAEPVATPRKSPAAPKWFGEKREDWI
jgi:phage terminase large subunit GpA-like protein